MRLITVFLLGIVFLSLVSATIPTDCESSIVAYWRFENNFQDSVGTYDGIVIGTVEWDSVEMVGSSFKYIDGTQKVTVSDSSPLDLNNVFTIEMFIQETNSENSILINKGNYNLKSIRDDDDYFSLESAVYDSYNKQWVNITSGTLDIDTKYHLALTWNGTTLQFFINGVSQGMAPLLDTSGTSFDLVFGEGFYGLIDEIAFYNKALPVNTIKSHYSKALSGKDYCESGASGFSSTSSEFQIRGCSVKDHAGNYLFGVPQDSCSKDGKYYCDSSEKLYYTLADVNGCSLGGNCCPSGFKCNASNICEARTVDCTTYIAKGDINTANTCLGEKCFWIEKDGSGFCTEKPSDFSCGYYEDISSCTEDLWNLGQEGTGTEVCGTYIIDSTEDKGYVIRQSNCKCSWIVNKCLLSYTVEEELFGLGETQNKFTCNKYYNVSSCMEGRQHINWTSGVSAGQGDNFGSDTTLRQKIANATSCSSGELDRSCGDAVVKVPLFGLYQFIAASLIISLFYWLRRLQ